MDSMLAKILIDLPDSFRHLIDSKLTFVSAVETLDAEKAPVVPIISLTFYRTEKNGSD